MEHLDESKEMYLKAIYNIERNTDSPVKPVQVAAYLNVSKPSVSEMLRKLSESSYLSYETYKPIRLTKKGLNRVKQVTRTYKIVENFLINVLGFEEKQAVKEACKLEHVFSDEVISKLETLVKKYKR